MGRNFAAILSNLLSHLAAPTLALATLGPIPAAHAGEAAAEKAGGAFALPAPKDFAAGVLAIERATGVKGAAIEAAQGNIPLAEGRSFALQGRVAEQLLAGSHAAFRKSGIYLFRYERSFGVAGEKDKVALLAAADRGAVIRRIGTASPHHGLTSDRIAAWLDALAKDEPFELWEVGVDYVAGRFDRVPKDPAALARRTAEFAPDLVAGRASTLDLLAEEIRVNRTLYLIW